MEFTYTGSTCSIKFHSNTTSFVERKRKQKATARDFERSLEYMLDDLSSATSSCSDLYSSDACAHNGIHAFERNGVSAGAQRYCIY